MTTRERSNAIFEAILAGGPAWEWMKVGIEIGAAGAYGQGCDDTNAWWTSVTTLACRTALDVGPSHAEMGRRRSECDRPALTAEEIRERAEASWAQVEAEIQRERAA